jgi:hypothetical protein
MLPMPAAMIDFAASGIPSQALTAQPWRVTDAGRLHHSDSALPLETLRADLCTVFVRNVAEAT